MQRKSQKKKPNRMLREMKSAKRTSATGLMNTKVHFSCCVMIFVIKHDANNFNLHFHLNVYNK